MIYLNLENLYACEVKSGVVFIGILFEKDNYSKISFVSFSLDWLTNAKGNGL